VTLLSAYLNRVEQLADVGLDRKKIQYCWVKLKTVWWRTVVRAVMNLWVPSKAGNVLTSRVMRQGALSVDLGVNVSLLARYTCILARSLLFVTIYGKIGIFNLPKEDAFSQFRLSLVFLPSKPQLYHPSRNVQIDVTGVSSLPSAGGLVQEGR